MENAKGVTLAVVGGRDFRDRSRVYRNLDTLQHRIARIVSGGASGADTLGVDWAKSRGIPFEEFQAAWDDLDAPGAVIRTNKKTGRPYNVVAGFQRNKLIIAAADAVLAYWDGASRGTKDSIDYAQSLGKPVQIFNY